MHPFTPMGIAILLGLTAAQAAPPARLSIVSPAPRTIVAPGTSVIVRVEAPASAQFKSVDVVGPDPIGMAHDLKTAMPADFRVPIPAAMNLGPCLITAVGVTKANEIAYSIPVALDVERDDLPLRLTAPAQTMSFDGPGEISPVMLLASFADGSAPEASRSSRVTYTSSDPRVVTVDDHAVAQARAPGRATITAAYRLDGRSVELAIPVTVRARQP